MIEDEKTDVFDLHATQGKGAAHNRSDAWIKRTGSQHGGLLAQIRDELLARAGIGHDDLVLDLHARTGLLSNEASRITREGGVWALAHDKREFETLSGFLAGDALRKPQVIATSFATFGMDLRTMAGETVRFNVIIGRNILTQQKEKKEIIEKALELLTTNGRIVLAEVVPSLGQRLSELLRFPRDDSSFASRFQDVEKELFSDATDALLNWEPESFARDLEKIPSVSVKVFSTTVSPITRVLPANVEFWFRSTSEQQRKSLGRRLEFVFTTQEMMALKAMFHEQFDNKEIPWKTVIAYFKITRE
jgi:putative ATPase